jgi:hypothetical protein
MFRYADKQIELLQKSLGAKGLGLSETMQGQCDASETIKMQVHCNAADTCDT